MAHLWPRSPKNVIFGSFWDSLGPPFGTLLGAFFGSGPPLEALGVHFSSIFDLCGRLSVSMSILDPKNSLKMSISGVADVLDI